MRRRLLFSAPLCSVCVLLLSLLLLPRVPLRFAVVAAAAAAAAAAAFICLLRAPARSADKNNRSPTVYHRAITLSVPTAFVVLCLYEPQVRPAGAVPKRNV